MRRQQIQTPLCVRTVGQIHSLTAAILKNAFEGIPEMLSKHHTHTQSQMSFQGLREHGHDQPR